MKRPALIALALVAACLFAGLGAWQVERLAWKRDLIARVEARVHAAPVQLRADMDARAEEYRRVTVRGAYRYDREALVQAVTERGGGYWVMTPMRTPIGTVLVNRGFVGPDKRGQGGSLSELPAPETVTGLLRASEPGGGFLRANDPAHDRWYSRDVAAIARARGLGPVAPFFVDAEASPAPGPHPIGGLTVVRFSNNHLLYALTWFALAAMSAAAAWLLLRRQAE